uniref:Transmembrane protein 182 n=1 Tax=Sander lucioperca TaxID=283035 RepID=A0A8D0AUW3_SANLU
MLKVLLFLALFFGATGFLFTLLSCGTEYWLLAAESCSRPEEREVPFGFLIPQVIDGVRIFHEGLFWRCSFMAVSNEHSIWDILIPNQPPSKVCHTAFLFPFPTQPYEHQSAIGIFRTFWSIFLATGLAAVVISVFIVICAGPLTNHRLYKVGGLSLCLSGLCLLAVMVMYLMWVQVLDTLEQFAHHQRVSTCPSFHLSIQHGPSFLLAPVAVFFCLLAGLLFIMIGQSIQGTQLDKINKVPV